jgi:hypothetical protein
VTVCVPHCETVMVNKMVPKCVEKRVPCAPACQAPCGPAANACAAPCGNECCPRPRLGERIRACLEDIRGRLCNRNKCHDSCASSSCCAAPAPACCK